MTFPKFLVIASALLFVTIGVLAFVKSGKSAPALNSEALVSSSSGTRPAAPSSTAPIAITLEREIRVVPQLAKVASSPGSAPLETPNSHSLTATSGSPATSIPISATQPPAPKPAAVERSLPDADLIYQLFNKGDPKLPFVETITYKSRVSWLKGRPAWLSDYAGHYGTSRHFIARSLNGKPDYLKQDIVEGDTFNVFIKDKNIQFHLLVDISRSKVWFYVFDQDSKELTLLKTYRVSLGRFDSQRASGLLTPLGKYSLGSKVAIYRPKVEGYYNGRKVEMMRIFGTRWIPFDKEIAGCTAPAKGLGIHGVPWVANASGVLVEDTSSLGKFESDGCIRFATEDIEELFAILLTKPTVIELVKDYFDAKLPGTQESVSR